jgi:hypothetical protein
MSRRNTRPIAALRGINAARYRAFGRIDVIRLARIHAEVDVAIEGLDELARAGPLDLLQLDYARPRRVAASPAEAGQLPEYAHSAIGAVRGMRRSLFLEPEFRIVTSAGWNDAYGCTEQVARALVESGSPGIPVSAVRGSNLLGILDFLVADGMALDNAETGAPWRTLREPVLTAEVQLGAGPIAAALSEGARVVVAGCYDSAAPLIAAAVSQFQWSWKDLNLWAGAAAAARAALWPNDHTCEWLGQAGRLPATMLHPRVALEDCGAFTVDVDRPLTDADAQRLVAWLRRGASPDAAHRHGDVQWHCTGVDVSQPGPSQLRVEGCQGAPGDDTWRLEVLYQSGFVVESLIELASGVDAPTRRRIADAFRKRFLSVDDERSLVAVQELANSDDAAASGSSWLHLVCRSKSRAHCQDFVAHLERLLTANPGTARSLSGRPTIEVECGLWPSYVPRGAVDIAIDTRPAKEWA